MSEELVNVVYPSLFHYTSDGGLEGILQTKSLWATHYRFLNDTKELRVFIEALKDRVGFVAGISLHEQKIKLQQFEEIWLNLINYFEKYASHYLICFCPEDKYGIKNGRLSQWTRYGRDGGYAIEFDTSKLAKLLEMECRGRPELGVRYPVGITFGSVGYYNDIKKKIRRDGIELTDIEQADDNSTIEVIEAALKKLFNLLSQNSQAAALDNLTQESLNEFMEHFAHSAARLKHYGFHEEREIRIVAPAIMEDNIKMVGTKISPKSVYFRFRDKVPYIVLFEESTFDDLFKQAVKGIIIGPGNHQERRKIKAQIMLKRYGYDDKNIDIRYSDIPYTA